MLNDYIPLLANLSQAHLYSDHDEYTRLSNSESVSDSSISNNEIENGD